MEFAKRLIKKPYLGGSHKISWDEWPWETYPNYADGPAYLMHGTWILPLMDAIRTTPTIPFVVYLTEICSEKAGVTNQYSFGYNR